MRFSILLALALLPVLPAVADLPAVAGAAEPSDNVTVWVSSDDPLGGSASLLPGTYRVRASGTYTFNAVGDTADAEYIFTSEGSCIDLKDPAHVTDAAEGDTRYDLQDSVPDFSIRQWGTDCEPATHTYGPTRLPNVGVEDYVCDDLVCPVRFWVDDPDSYADNVGTLKVHFEKIG